MLRVKEKIAHFLCDCSKACKTNQKIPEFYGNVPIFFCKTCEITVDWPRDGSLITTNFFLSDEGHHLIIERIKHLMYTCLNAKKICIEFFHVSYRAFLSFRCIPHRIVCRLSARNFAKLEYNQFIRRVKQCLIPSVTFRNANHSSLFSEVCSIETTGVTLKLYFN